MQGRKGHDGVAIHERRLPTGHAFLPPHMNGTLRMANPGESVVTLTWRGGGISVAAGGVEHSVATFLRERRSDHRR